MNTEAQKILMSFKMEETFNGVTCAYPDDLDELLEMLNDESVDQTDIDDSTHYSFSDGSKIIEQYNTKHEKVFNYYF